MNKRLTSLILAVVMLLSLTVTAVPTFATGTDNGLSLSKEKASAGETFELYLKIPPITAGKSAANEFKIDYDKAVVKLTEFNPGCPSGASIGAYSTPDEANDAGQVGVNYNTAGGGNLADWSEGLTYTFKFQVLDSAAVGNTKFEITTYTIVGYEEDGYTEIDYTPADVVKEAILNITAAPKPATGISLNKSTLELTVGESETLVATVEPADTTDTVTWESDNTDVATVDTNGKVTAVATGTATITAKAGSQSATCVVTVTNAPCAHTNKSTVSAKESTCTDKGWDEYKKCDDCGQLFNTSDEKIDEVPFRNLAKHTGGTATCTAKAVCSVCHQPYDDYAAHSYTAETKKAEALKTAGNCRDKAVYYYSCSVCGNVESNGAHTFLGDKNASVHVGGTSTVNASEPDHKNQVDGYTGDTKCLGCGKIIATGTSIPAGAHTPSSTWNSDGTYHWKECTTMGCGVVIDGSKAKHNWTPATCTVPKTCSVCHATEGVPQGHTEGTEWKYDSDNHWHICTVAGCGVVIDSSKAAHNYGTDNKCTKCGYAKPSYSGGYIPTIQKPTIEAGEGVKVTLSTDGTVATITVDPAYEIADVVLNGTSKGKVTEVKGLKTGDKLVVTAAKKAAEPTKEDILAALADQKLVARSKVVTMKNGKKAVRITWYNQNGEMMDFDGVEIFRSTKRNSGYGKKPIFTSETDKYYNTAVKAGTKYYYKLRGYVVIDGQKYYTDYSLKAIRTVK